jgi:N-acetylneuraminic acid mutarotase
MAPMPTARSSAATAVGANGLIYVIGGQSTGCVFNTVEAYNPSTNIWTTPARIPTPRAGLAAATGMNGVIYAVGGAIATIAAPGALNVNIAE